MDTTQLLKGVLDVAVLAVITDEDGYGYDVVRRLRSSGLRDVGDASVYGTLKRLYTAGALTSYVVPSEDGPHRKYYGINSQGRAMLAEQREAWQQFSGTMSALLDDSERAAAQPHRISAPRGQSVRAPSEKVDAVRASEQKLWKIGDTL